MTNITDTTIQILENFLGETSLKSTLSLINGNCVFRVTHHFETLVELNKILDVPTSCLGNTTLVALRFRIYLLLPGKKRETLCTGLFIKELSCVFTAGKRKRKITQLSPLTRKCRVSLMITLRGDVEHQPRCGVASLIYSPRCVELFCNE